MSALHQTLDTATGFDPALMSVPFNRRVTIRYPCGLATSTKLKIENNDPFRRVRGHNISQGGMALILEECPEVGALVNIRMKNRILNFSYDLSARIVHVAPTDNDGEYLVGLAFSRQLTLAELASLL
jgi:c-di-GMP-binding flagellar brake protein YcgR